MKKYYFLLSTVLALCITACGNNAGKGSQGGESKAPEMTPVAEPTMEVDFAAIEDNCMVPTYVQDYIDAMHEQEGRIQYPHRVDRLFCNMDWDTAASQRDQGDGVQYDDDHSGGVDVCQMLSRSQSYENKPIVVKWEDNGDDFSEAKVVFWSKEDKSDQREVAVEAGGLSAKLPNLFRNTKYYYQLVNGEEASQMKNFVTGDYTRMISMGSVGNIRDMGGYQSSYGGMINQGLIYRGSEINQEAFSDGSSSHSKNFNVDENSAEQKVQKEVLNIGLELDFRTKSGCASKIESALAYDGEWVWENTYPNKDLNTNDNGRAQYVRSAINAYDSFITDQNRSSEADNANRNVPKEIFEYFARADEQHVYFHCWGGADRTGVTGFLLLGILGATYTDAIIDFELTTLTNNKRCHMHNSSNAHFPKFLQIFTSEYTFTRDGVEYKYEFDEEKTFNKNSENLLVAMGIEIETIEKIRTIMIPGYETGVSEENEMVNKGWQQQFLKKQNKVALIVTFFATMNFRGHIYEIFCLFFRQW